MIKKIKKYIKKYIDEIKRIFSEMNNIQKFISAVVFLIIMIILVNVLSKVIVKDRKNGIDYKHTSGNDICLSLNTIHDDDLYVTLKNISDDIFSIIMGNKYDEQGKEVSITKVYNDIITSSYKQSISKISFNNRVKNIYEKIDLIKSNDITLIPDNILEYSNNYYMLRYRCEMNNETIEIYIGIALDTTRNIYYIWYLE